MNYSELAQIYDQLESTSKRLEKTWIISRLLQKTKEEDIDKIVLLIQGRVFPAWDDTKIGISERSVIKAISVTTGSTVDQVEKAWKKIGDLGRVCEELVSKKSQVTLFSKELTVDKVFTNIKSLANMEGAGSVDLKVKTISELLTSAKPIEARYVVRTILEDLRVGVGSGSIRDALTWAFFEKEANIHYNEIEKSITPENREEYNRLTGLVQRAFDFKADFAEVAKLIKSKGEKAFEEMNLEVGKPVNVMLYQKAKNLENAFERVGKPCALEYKYDGFRVLMHKEGNKVKVFTRRLEEVTNQFPEIAKAVLEQISAQNCILDGEAVGYDPKTYKYRPFQEVSQRIKRKYDIDKLAKELPVEVHVFDILLLDGKDMLQESYINRRRVISEILKPKVHHLVLAKQIITSDLQEAQKFYEAALKDGQEGIMAKNLDGIYQPGNRVGFGVKVKPVMESLDLAIVGAEWGTGKRSGWLTSFILACRDGSKFLEIGRVGTGLKELEEEGVSFEELTNLIKPNIIGEDGKLVKVKPDIVIEIHYEEIQKSPTYSSGYALRFPRFIRLRHDKPLSEVSNLELVEELYYNQHG